MSKTSDIINTFECHTAGRNARRGNPDISLTQAHKARNGNTKTGLVHKTIIKLNNKITMLRNSQILFNISIYAV